MEVFGEVNLLFNEYRTEPNDRPIVDNTKRCNIITENNLVFLRRYRTINDQRPVM